jgi:hypothetical protein
MAATLLVEKYVDGVPLHRQRERLARLGLDIAVSTLADQIKWCTDLLRPLWRAALAEMIAARVMHLDGTGLTVLDGNTPGNKKIGALWGYVGVNAGEVIAAYLYMTTGKATGQRPGELGPQDMLGLREGPTVADASGLFDASFARTKLVECGCNMHARRYLMKALDGGDKRAALPIAAYKKLYEIERDLRDRELGPDAVLAERQTRGMACSTFRESGARSEHLQCDIELSSHCLGDRLGAQRFDRCERSGTTHGTERGGQMDRFVLGEKRRCELPCNECCERLRDTRVCEQRKRLDRDLAHGRFLERKDEALHDGRIFAKPGEKVRSDELEVLAWHVDGKRWARLHGVEDPLGGDRSRSGHEPAAYDALLLVGSEWSKRTGKRDQIVDGSTHGPTRPRLRTIRRYT